jgi:hypothetical protein
MGISLYIWLSVRSIPKGCWFVVNIQASFHENPSVYLKVVRELKRQRDKTVYQFLGLTLLFEKKRVYFMN